MTEFNSNQLRFEVKAAGLDVLVVVLNNEVFVVAPDGKSHLPYQEAGEWVDVAALQRVIDAHTPPPTITPPDFGDDDAKQEHIAEGVVNLRAYLGLANPTAAQTREALKLTIRAVLFILRRML